jgi:DNA repair protein RecN (Recombination protein N)
VQYEEYAEELQQKVKTAKKELDQAAEALSAERKIQAKELCKRVSEALEDLSFNQIRFDMHFDRLTHPGTSGIDDCYFVVSEKRNVRFMRLHPAVSFRGSCLRSNPAWHRKITLIL